MQSGTRPAKGELLPRSPLAPSPHPLPCSLASRGLPHALRRSARSSDPLLHVSANRAARLVPLPAPRLAPHLAPVLRLVAIPQPTALFLQSARLFQALPGQSSTANRGSLPLLPRRKVESSPL